VILLGVDERAVEIPQHGPVQRAFDSFVPFFTCQ